MKSHATLAQRTAASFFLLLASAFFSLGGVEAAYADVELLGHGPVVAVGYIEDTNNAGVDEDLTFAQAGWGWRMDGPDAIDAFFSKIHTDFSWKVEALGGAIMGDSESVEASVVPFMLLEPASAGRWVPYFEAGVGLIYSDLRGFDLGSRFMFSDNIGVGLAYNMAGGRRVSLGYRLRHISHASLWADKNDGLNTHFLVFSFE